MNTRGLSRIFALGVALALGAVACGSTADDAGSAGDEPSATTTTTAQPSSTTAASNTTVSDDLAIFCANAVPIGFTSLTDIQPLDPTAARELRAKLNLIQASAPDDIVDTLITIRETTNPYLDAVEAGEITDNNTVITWASNFDIPTIEATVEALPVMGAYVVEHC